MKILNLSTAFFIIPWIATIGLVCSSWGFHAHRLINRAAIYTLPPPLIGYFKPFEEQLIARAVDADKRKYVDSLEAVRHYIDIDRYAQSDSIPKYIKASELRQSPGIFQSFGIVPWQIEITFQRLIQAFKSQDNARIIQNAADLAHYISDAHVPLHTSKNYNGQYSNQIGIHALWESSIPEYFSDTFYLFVGQAQWIADPQAKAWQIVEESHKLVPQVLAMELEASRQLHGSDKKGYFPRNKRLHYQYSPEFIRLYHQLLDGMVEAQMQASIYVVGAYWYTAWIQAGQPTL